MFFLKLITVIKLLVLITLEKMSEFSKKFAGVFPTYQVFLKKKTAT